MAKLINGAARCFYIRGFFGTNSNASVFRALQIGPELTKMVILGEPARTKLLFLGGEGH